MMPNLRQLTTGRRVDVEGSDFDSSVWPGMPSPLLEIERRGQILGRRVPVAQRLESTRCSMKARIEVVSYRVWSTKPVRANAR
jgi:hypothetical protein